jgi:hypothetical protein
MSPIVDRAHHRLAEAFGDPLARFLEPLVQDLASEVDVDVVREVDVHDREAEVRDRAMGGREPVHGGLDGVGLSLDVPGEASIAVACEVRRHVREASTGSCW